MHFYPQVFHILSMIFSSFVGWSTSLSSQDSSSSKILVKRKTRRKKLIISVRIKISLKISIQLYCLISIKHDRLTRHIDVKVNIYKHLIHFKFALRCYQRLTTRQLELEKRVLFPAKTVCVELTLISLVKTLTIFLPSPASYW